MAIALMLSFVSAQSRIVDQAFVGEDACPNGVCMQQIPSGNAGGISISGAVSVEITACVAGGRFVGVGSLETWINAGKWVLANQEQPEADLSCQKWAYNVDPMLAGKSVRLVVRPNSLAVRPKSARLRITYTKKVLVPIGVRDGGSAKPRDAGVRHKSDGVIEIGYEK